jgi:hypothetical protein
MSRIRRYRMVDMCKGKIKYSLHPFIQGPFALDSKTKEKK